jgi:single-strand DNA-binding protein
MRLPGLCSCQIVGRVVTAPDLKYTAKGTAVCNFKVCVSMMYKRKGQTEWTKEDNIIPIVGWADLAQLCCNNLKDNDPVYIYGKLKSREGKEGKWLTVEVLADKIEFLKEAADENGAAGPADVPE